MGGARVGRSQGAREQSTRTREWRESNFPLDAFASSRRGILLREATRPLFSRIHFGDTRSYRKAPGFFLPLPPGEDHFARRGNIPVRSATARGRPPLGSRKIGEISFEIRDIAYTGCRKKKRKTLSFFGYSIYDTLLRRSAHPPRLTTKNGNAREKYNYINIKREKRNGESRSLPSRVSLVSP